VKGDAGRPVGPLAVQTGAGETGETGRRPVWEDRPRPKAQSCLGKKPPWITPVVHEHVKARCFGGISGPAGAMPDSPRWAKGTVRDSARRKAGGQRVARPTSLE